MDTDMNKVKENAKNEKIILEEQVKKVTGFKNSMDALQKDMDLKFGAIIKKMEAKVNSWL